MQNLKALYWSVLSAVLLTAGTPALAVWTSEQAVAWGHLMKNVSHPDAAKGSVVASPSKYDPDYFFHWVRDAGLVMEPLIARYTQTERMDEKQALLGTLWDYVNFNERLQATPNYSGGVGEPKFHADGRPYNDNWGRPQDDSPAIRALSLIHLANVWLKEGHEDWVRSRLYNGFLSPIKMDLEYVSHNWQNVSFDLWEETVAHHFFTEMVQRRALLEGAVLAKFLGDWEAGGWYEKQAREIEHLIHRHWNGQRILTMLDHPPGAGLDYKYSGLDSAVILGILHGSLNDGFYDADNERVLATALQMEQAFYDVYPINRNGVAGVAIGRYPEDRYSGHAEPEGNPWFLTTNAFAQYYFLVAKCLRSRGEIRINHDNHAFFQALGLSVDRGQSISRGSQEFDRVVQRVVEKGDAFLNRTRYHMGADGHMSEQINRNNGYMQSARDLTWSYASLVTAIAERP